MEGQQRLLLDPEQQAAAERDVALAAQRDAVLPRVIARRELA
jgi:hypothetical protein